VIRSEREPDAPLHLASIGVTTKHKGFQVVIEALRQAAIPARYTILGIALKPGMEELWEAAEQAPELELRLFGGFPQHFLPALLADAEVVVVPSIVPETFSIVAREAFACGLPVIASNIGALPEAIRDGEDGWLFEPGDANQLAELLSRFDRDRDLLRAAGRKARSNRLVSIRERTVRVERVLEEAVARGPRGDDGRGAELRRMREALVEADVAQGLVV
jgi:glycosyltransferase involved in cell wall biosynthesis